MENQVSLENFDITVAHAKAKLEETKADYSNLETKLSETKKKLQEIKDSYVERNRTVANIVEEIKNQNIKTCAAHSVKVFDEKTGEIIDDDLPQSGMCLMS